MGKNEKNQPSPKKKRKSGGRQPGAGRHAFVVTSADRIRVKKMVGFGFSHDQICSLIINPTSDKPIDRNTLAKYFSEELACGKNSMIEMIAGNIARTAISKSHKDATRAAVFYLTHQAGWSSIDKAALEQEQDTADQRAAAIIAALAGMDATIGAGRAVRVAVANGHDADASSNGHTNGNGKAGSNGHEGNGNGTG